MKIFFIFFVIFEEESEDSSSHRKFLPIKEYESSTGAFLRERQMT